MGIPSSRRQHTGNRAGTGFKTGCKVQVAPADRHYHTQRPQCRCPLFPSFDLRARETIHLLAINQERPDTFGESVRVVLLQCPAVECQKEFIMTESVNRDGLSKSKNFLAFLKMYIGLERDVETNPPAVLAEPRP